MPQSAKAAAAGGSQFVYILGLYNQKFIVLARNMRQEKMPGLLLFKCWQRG
jgi:hypothetical protein